MSGWRLVKVLCFWEGITVRELIELTPEISLGVAEGGKTVGERLVCPIIEEPAAPLFIIEVFEP